MRPHVNDRSHNRRLGNVIAETIADCIERGLDDQAIAQVVGHCVNRAAQVGYDLGMFEALRPSQN